MAAPKWHEGPLIAFDTETTGTDVHNDHIVTAAIVTHRPGQRPDITQWILDPGVEIPAGAAEVHGWTNDAVRERLQGAQALRISRGHEKQLPLDVALYEIATRVAFATVNEIPLVLANAAYDLSLLDTELDRHQIDNLSSRPKGVTGVVDVQVIDKAHDPYRRLKGGCRGGKHKCGGCGAENRTLTGLCAHYGVRHTGAHDASGDALACIRLVPRLAAVWPEIARWKLPTLHANQIAWRKAQADGLRAYFDKEKIEHDGVCGEWPVHVACAPAKAVA